MSKHKSNSKRSSAPAPATAATMPGALSHKRVPRAVWIVGALAVIGVVAGVVIWRAQAAPQTAQSSVAELPQGSMRFTQGPAARCAANPAFVKTFGFDEKLSALSTSERAVRGLALVEIGPNGDVSRKGRTFQHPSWDDGGYLGPISRDSQGNVYAAPIPVISTFYNPTVGQNDLYRVDGLSGVLTRALSLPFAREPDDTNPYGILGLTLDCDTNSLYVSSVMGSTRKREYGRIFRVDLASGKVITQIDGVDAIGMGVFNGARGKRLYFGSARRSEIRAIALDDAGNFSGQPRVVIDLDGLGPRGDDKARRISFLANNTMIVYGIEFAFNLIAPTEKQETQYRFAYAAAADGWTHQPGQR